MGEKETYLVKFPCNVFSMNFKLSLKGDEEWNSHVQLRDRTRGNIWCKNAGSRDKWGGAKTDFGIEESWKCEDDGESMILE